MGHTLLSKEYALAQVGVLLAVVASGPTSDVAQLGLLLWALRGPAAAIQSLSLFIVVRGFNPLLAAHGALGGTLSWALPLLVSARLLPLVSAQCFRWLNPLWTFCVVAALCSVIGSPAPAVSLMKAATLTLVASGILVGCQRLTPAETQKLGPWLWTLAAVVAALSIALLVRPGMAHLPNSRLLNGILNQSQALGAFMAPFAAASLVQWLLARRTATSLHLAIWGTILACTLLTLSRTAALAAVLGMAFAVLGGTSGNRRTSSANIGRAIGIAAVLAFGLLLLELATGSVLRGLTSFALKGGDGTLEASFQASRGGLVSTQWHNFLASPIFGNGFGVYADGVFPSGISAFMGIPVSAPVEKGVLPTAVLEETGLLGFAAFAWLVYSLVAGVWRRAPHAVVAMLIACLFVNLGEAILLSPGGYGLHIWLLIGWCLRAAQVGTAPGTPVPLGGPPRRPYPNLLD
ncbi:MAG: hypothetical protein IT477_05400 [Rhodanobacteraceae bacterium]|nr:hypothetical protein [Rhodanobacteraceae bacterium]